MIWFLSLDMVGADDSSAANRFDMLWNIVQFSEQVATHIRRKKKEISI